VILKKKQAKKNMIKVEGYHVFNGTKSDKFEYKKEFETMEDCESERQRIRKEEISKHGDGTNVFWGLIYTDKKYRQGR